MLKINNVKVKRRSKTVLVTVNSDFYSPEIIATTIKKFSEVCEASAKEGTPKTTIMLKPKKSIQLKALGYEFMNHMLADMKNEVGL